MQASCQGTAKFPRGDYPGRVSEFMLLFRMLSERISFPVSHLLEIGCGNGFSLRLWAEIADQVTGADLPQAIDSARRMLEELPLPQANVQLLETRAEDLQLKASYELIVSQYVLEHVDDIEQSLMRIRAGLCPGAIGVHILINSVSRSNWYIQYRSQFSWVSRICHSLQKKGALETLANPAVYTPPHEPRFGTFDDELEHYRLDRWALRLMQAEFVADDWFQTSDINYVFVTRRLGP